MTKTFLIPGFIFLIALLNNSCVKVLDYDIPEDEKKIVINSMFASGDTFKVYVNKSMHILDKVRAKYLNDAVVQLFEGDQLLTEIKGGINGLYKSYVPLQNGHEYTLIVNSPGLQQVTAKTNIPVPVDIINVDTITEFSVNPNDYYYYTNTLKCDITFNDTPNAENYYELTCLEEHVNEVTNYINEDSILFEYVRVNEPIAFKSKDAVIEQWITGNSFSYHFTDDGYGSGNSIIFSDRLIDGKKHTLQIILFVPFMNDASMMKRTIDISLKSVTKNYYEYMQILEKHIIAANDPLAEPVLAYTNIENGLGIFSGYSKSVVRLNFGNDE